MNHTFLSISYQLSIVLLAACLALVYGKSLFIPLIFAGLLSFLIVPIASKLELWGIKRGIASFLCTFLVTLIFAGLFALYAYQISYFASDIPQLKDQIKSHIKPGSWLDNAFVKKAFNYVQSHIPALLSKIANITHNIFLAAVRIVFAIGLAIIYLFLLLDYRERLYTFVMKITFSENHATFKDFVVQTQNLVSHYLLGVLTVIVILSSLNILGLWIIGVKYAFLAGSLAGLFNIIPYVGVIAGSIFPLVMALFTKSPLWSLGAVLVLFFINQLLENNILTPYVVGSHMHVNPLMTMTFAIIRGLIWGIPGLILFTPLAGISKIIFDHIETLKPYAYLMGKEKSL